MQDVETPEVLPRVQADHLARAERAWRVRVAGGTWVQAAEVAGYGDDTAAIRGVRTAFGTLPQVERATNCGGCGGTGWRCCG